nr:MAG TPA: Protein of unknown function (DUF1609) [Caudoviricetes sp.]
MRRKSRRRKLLASQKAGNFFMDTGQAKQHEPIGSYSSRSDVYFKCIICE